ncbi:MAG: pyrroline-5-carboxylate reductase [Alphaproteobacteria bacterium]|nr:pyrroline-5-carboxylate reductase [Alphaproteobacteria bacterium]MCB9791598.1 pyrroline-5-carboxylate reductase [Alphaproteobacteria bacterium]
MSDVWTLGFVGAGVMAETMIAGVLSQGVIPPERVLASDPNPARRAELVERHGVRATGDNHLVAGAADLIVLAVKPQNLKAVFADLKGAVKPDAQLLSIVAGASIAALQGGLDHRHVARAMPNLPCRIHMGMTVWTGAEGLRAERIQQVLSGMGQQIKVEAESHVDRATAVNGTGPAIVAEFVKAMFEAATFLGQPRDLAHETVLATVLGTAEMIRQSDSHVAQLIDEVTSPGGTTSRALQVLKQGRFSAVVTDSFDAAYQRTLALGASLEDSLVE